MALHAEQEAARRRLEDLARRQSDAEKRVDDLQTALDKHHVDELLNSDEVYEIVVDHRFEATASDVLSAVEHDESELNLELLESRVAELNDELELAGRELIALVPKSTEQMDWVDFRRHHDIVAKDRGVWEWMYDQICEMTRQEVREAEAKKRSGYLSQILTPTLADTDLMRPIGIPNILTSQREAALADSLREKLDESRLRVRSIRQERELAHETYEATRQPEGFGLALQVLSVLAFLGMGVPVVVMGFSPLTLPLWARAATIASFFVGVSLLLRFLFVYASYLREGGRAQLPKTVLGLAKSR